MSASRREPVGARVSRFRRPEVIRGCVANSTVLLRRSDPLQLVWMVKEFGRLERDHQDISPPFPGLPPEAAGRGREAGGRLLACQTPSPAAQGGWGRSETVEPTIASPGGRLPTAVKCVKVAANPGATGEDIHELLHSVCPGCWGDPASARGRSGAHAGGGRGSGAAIPWRRERPRYDSLTRGRTVRSGWRSARKSRRDRPPAAVTRSRSPAAPGALALQAASRWSARSTSAICDLEFTGDAPRAGHTVVLELPVLTGKHLVFTPSERGVMSVAA